MDNSKQPVPVLDDQEESVRIAVKALGDMRNSAGRKDRHPPLSPISSSHSSSYTPKSPPPQSPTSSVSRESGPSEPSTTTSNSTAFVSRMSHLPFVNSALRVYEQGKASSRVVKYGAEMMESSVKTISRPVIDRLPVNVNTLDEFACRQLDRLDRYRRPSTNEEPQSSTTSTRTTGASESRDRDVRSTNKTEQSDTREDWDRLHDINMTRDEPLGEERPNGRQWRPSERDVPSWLEATSPFVAPPPPPPSSKSSQATDDNRSTTSETPSVGERQVAQRSRWQAVLLEAGGLSAALSEESMRRLKYCLQWLQYATAHIDAQILILRDFTASLQPLPSDNASARRPPISDEHMKKLTDVRRDIVHTIRQVVDVVSKYAGGALPEPARARVRGFILKLPQRWATRAGVPTGAGVTGPNGVGASERETVAAAASGTGVVRRPGGQRRAAHRERGAGGESGLRSGASSRAPSPSTSPRMTRGQLNREGGANGAGSSGNVPDGQPASQVSAGTALVAAQRILTLATESLDMMRNVTGVMKDSLDRADAWVGRLRTVGIQRGAQEGEDVEDGSEFEFGVPESQKFGHRRTGSAASYDDQELDMPSPFFSGASSTAWGSSIPSTPGGPNSNGKNGCGYGGFAGSAPSPSANSIPIGSMSLASRYNTPKSVVVDLPDVEEERGNGKVSERGGDVRVVGVDEDVGELKGVQKMDVDP
ncbi:hypothetical protein CVT24_012107 [Panaeolus cyanescens]|uniref:Opi1-domain-containing protein n=1 Tax=Panaeolus cyanescens TaxID=181874 RepID=A0A409VHF1_9AGAR|nr:hypothetical protein CVT24_012107 [Panaeolus cyanescens]